MLATVSALRIHIKVSLQILLSGWQNSSNSLSFRASNCQCQPKHTVNVYLNRLPPHQHRRDTYHLIQPNYHSLDHIYVMKGSVDIFFRLLQGAYAPVHFQIDYKEQNQL